MLGAGVFAAFGPASDIAGKYALIGVVLAALLAACSAFSTADQARAFPGAAPVTATPRSCSALARPDGRHRVHRRPAGRRGRHRRHVRRVRHAVAALLGR